MTSKFDVGPQNLTDVKFWWNHSNIWRHAGNIWCQALISGIHCDYPFDFKSHHLNSAVKKIEVSIKYLAQFVKNWLTPSKFDVQEYLTTQVKFCRNKCVLPKWWDTNMKSNFDVGLEIWSKVTILSHTWAILMNFFAHLVISHFPIDHMIAKGFFMTLKSVKSALKGIILIITRYAL